MKQCRTEGCVNTDLATRSTLCKKCHREYTRAHYAANKGQYLNRNRRRRKEIRDFVREAKSAPCADCGVSYPYYVMDFDHLGVEEKLDSVSRLSPKGLKIVRDEIAKCEVVCSNCHRQRTHDRILAEPML